MQNPAIAPVLPLVSVVIAAFNAEDSLDRAVQSALAQKLPVEVIIVDDASGDQTVAIAERLMDQDPRVRLVLRLLLQDRQVLPDRLVRLGLRHRLR